MPQGNRGSIRIKKEHTWGVRNGTDLNDLFLPFVSESLTANIEEVLSAIQRGERDEPKSYHGQRDFAGDIVIEVHPRSIGHILRSAINIPNPSGGFAEAIATLAREHVFTPIKTHDDEFSDDCPLRPYTLEVDKDDGLDAFEFKGSVVNKLSLAFSTTDKILKATCGILAKDLNKIAPTGVALEATNPFMWNDAKIFIANKDKVVDIAADDDLCNDIESFKVDFDNNCIAKFALNNTAIARKFIFNGYVAIPVNFVVDFVNQTEFDYFIAGTERQFIIVLDGDVILDSEPNFRYRLRIDMPLVRYTAYPINIGGPGRLSCAVVGKAKYSGETAWKYAIRFTIWNKQDLNEYA